jgi:hypothetical protein
MTQTLVSDGIFMGDNFNSISKISDGTSNTLMVCECTYAGWILQVANTWSCGQGVPRNNSATGTVPHAAFVCWDGGGEMCDPGSGRFTQYEYQKPDGSGTGCGFIAGSWNPAYTMPSFITYEGIQTDWLDPGGSHPGTSIIAMADGSSRGLNNNVTYDIWYKICAMQDGASVTLP